MTRIALGNGKYCYTPNCKRHSAAASTSIPNLDKPLPSVSTEEAKKALGIATPTPADETLYPLIEEDATVDPETYLDFYTDGYRPGCSGCTGDGGDYCRCSVITGITIESATNKNAAKIFYAQVFSMEPDRVPNGLAEIAESNGILDPSNYEIETSGDYYGEVLDSVALEDHVRRNIIEKSNAWIVAQPVE